MIPFSNGYDTKPRAVQQINDFLGQKKRGRFAEKKSQMRRMILCTEGVNAYGYRILVKGADLTLFSKNPVMLWMHIRGKIIGKWKDVKIEDGKITAEPVFAKTKEGQHYKELYEDDMINMASIWVQPLEWSEDAKLRIEGQTQPTVTKWVLKEGSLVDIAADSDAIKLVDDNNQEFKLSDFKAKSVNFKNNFDMPDLFEFLKLAEGASNDTVLEAVKAIAQERDDLSVKLADKTTAFDALKGEKEALEQKLAAEAKTEFEGLLNAPERKLTKEQKETYQKLFEASPEAATAAVKALPTYQHLSANGGGDTGEEDESRKGWTLADYMENDPEAVEKMKLNDKPKYIKLFEAQYGKKPKNVTLD
jgi:hypothetical protein